MSVYVVVLDLQQSFLFCEDQPVAIEAYPVTLRVPEIANSKSIIYSGNLEGLSVCY